MPFASPFLESLDYLKKKKRNFLWKQVWGALCYLCCEARIILERCLSHGDRAPQSHLGHKAAKGSRGTDVETCAHADTDPTSGQAYFNPSTCQVCRGSAGVTPLCFPYSVASGTSKLISWIVLSAGGWEDGGGAGVWRTESCGGPSYR